MYADVLLTLPLDRSFTYAVPAKFQGSVARGLRVKVPFRGTTKTGFIADLFTKPPSFEVREILEVLETEPLLTPALFSLGRWIAETWICSWGEALNAMLPGGVKKRQARRTIPAAKAAASPPAVPPRTDVQRRLYDLVRASDEPIPVHILAARAKSTRGPIKSLAVAGYIEIVQLESSIDTLDEGADPGPQDLKLTPEQAAALQAINEALDKKGPRGILLHGVTGSGKTEVYLRAIQRVVAEGRQAIVLVPEIALTPQTVARFKARFPRIAVLHSVLSETDRAHQWRRARSGEIDVIVGARSAIFAPTRSLGLVILDEEHEGAYKQESDPRYHARDVALHRADLEGAAVILGSATPSMESLHAARTGKLRLVRLPTRIGDRPMPPVQIVDMTAERRETKRFPLLSRVLVNAAKAAGARKEQILLFLNQRGYTRIIRCKRCEWTFRCTRCDVSVTFHKTENLAECHTCGKTMAVPDICPECKVGALWHFGVGTEKIEEEIKRALPGLTVERMDSDRMKTRADYRKALGGLWQGTTDVIVGTQMIAKGLDVPNVTVIGVTNADTAFFVPDFRSSERTFSLLTQVAGRAGRGPKGGKVIIQTFNPSHYAITCAAAYDFDGFAEKELQSRRELGYPPYSRLVRILVHGFDEKAVRAAAAKLGDKLRPLLPPVLVEMLGPAPAPIFRIKSRFRMNILLKARDMEPVKDAIRKTAALVKGTRSLQVVVDVDPVSLV